MFDQALETLPWPEQADRDANLFASQMDYLSQHSQFYQKKLSAAGVKSPGNLPALADLSTLPFTEKDELRATRTPENAVGTHLAVGLDKIVRIYSTSGTTGTPSYIPLTNSDVGNWITTACRAYAASGLDKGERIVTTYNSGPFVAGATSDAFARLALCQIPVGSGNSERLMAAIDLLAPSVLALTPSYALHLAEWAEARGMDLAKSSVNKLLVAGEPGGGEPAMRARLETAWGAKVTEAMGIGDISVSLWGECEAQQGMHFAGRDFVHFELIDPATGALVPLEDGARGELVYTHLQHQAAPLLRFRSRDHVEIHLGQCTCGRTAPRVRCIGRTDDMLIVRGVNVFPSAVREVLGQFGDQLSGFISIRPNNEGVKQSPPLPIVVELAENIAASAQLAATIQKRLREILLFTAEIDLAPWGTLPRTDYKSSLVVRPPSKP